RVMIPSVAPPATPRSLRQRCGQLWSEPDSRSVVIGLLGMLVIHVLLLLLGPQLLRFEPVLTVPAGAATKQYNIELTPDSLVKAEEKQEPFNFVETNPEAPENIPDETPNFGAHNQQVAQEVATPDGTSDRPALEGEPDRESNQIVSGELTRPVEMI